MIYPLKLNFDTTIYGVIPPCQKPLHRYYEVQVLGSKLTHWGRVTHTYVNKLTIIGSDNGLSPGRCQAIIWTNDEQLLIGPLETNFS